MKIALYVWALALVFGPWIIFAATIPTTYTNANFWESAHEAPAYFNRDAAGNFWGFTVSGRQFTQTNVENTAGVRLQRFAIDEAYFYVSDRGVIVAATDIQALSMYLASQDYGA